MKTTFWLRTMKNKFKMENEVDNVMAGSMQAMEVSLNRLHSPASESESQAKKRRENVVDVSDGEGGELSPPMEPANADSAEGDQLARLEQDNSNDSLLLDIEQVFHIAETCRRH